MIFRLLLMVLFVFAMDAKQLLPQIAENLYGECILQTIPINIPGYPKAFNPSLLSYKDGYLLSFRFRSHLPKEIHTFRVDASFIGVVKLNKQFEIIEDSIHLLHISSYDSFLSLYAEDGRIFKIGERLFVIFNDLHLLEASDGFRMYLAEIVETDERIDVKGPAIPLKYPSAISVEKNWTPFVFEDTLYLIYSDFPRVILEVDLATGDCKEVVRTSLDNPWKYGAVRGGTPASLTESGYLTFFHSRVFGKRSDGKEVINYIMGAYLFEPYFPFAVQKMTPFPLGESTYYSEDNSKKIVYPCGMTIEGDKIYVAWGKNDNAIYLTTFDKKKLFELMDTCPLDGK